MFMSAVLQLGTVRTPLMTKSNYKSVLKNKSLCAGVGRWREGGGESGETGLCKHHISTACKFINFVKNEMMNSGLH